MKLRFRISKLSGEKEGEEVAEKRYKRKCQV